VTYEIFPVVACVAGVLNGGLITAEELERSAPSWAGRVVTLSHPVDDNGEAIPANAPDVWSEWAIGHLFGVHVSDGKLKGEMWLHPAKTPRDVMNGLRSGKLTDVSIGYFCDQRPETGNHNGKAYEEKHVALRPDHLALLPDEEGACNIEDGCGVPRTNSIQQFASQLITAVKAACNSTTCNCDNSDEKEGDMPKDNDVTVMLRKLHVAEKLTAKQIEMLQNFDEEQLAMVRALVEMMLDQGGTEEAPAEPAEPEAGMGEDDHERMMDDPEDKPANFAKRVREAVAAELETQSKHREAIASVDLESAGITEDDAKAMPVETLQRLAKRHPSRKADFSAFAGHAAAEKDDGYRPMGAPAGVLAHYKKS